MRRLLAALLALLALSAAALAQLGASGDDDKGVLASLISRALSTPTTRVSIGAVEGALSSDATVRDIAISDRDGVWLRLDRARIVWRRLALLQRRLEIDTLEIGTLDIARRPIPAEGRVAGEDEPLLPELPVKVEIKAFTLADLRIGEPILGAPAQVTATGKARLGDLAEGLDLTFDARRLDGTGALALRLGLIPQGERLTLKLALDEPAGGIAARAARIPGLPPVKLDLDGQGTLDAFAARLAFDAGPDIGATGGANLSRDGAGRRLALDLQARIAGLVPASAAPVFAGTTRLTGNLDFGDDRSVSLSDIELAAAAARVRIGGSINPEQVADLTLVAANLPTGREGTVAGVAAIRKLDLTARVTGPITAPNVDATLALDDARLPSGRLSALNATFALREAGRTPGGAVRLAVTADARATGLALTDPALDRALGGSLSLALRGVTTTELVAELDNLAVTTPTLTARYAGRLGSDELRGRVAFEAASLQPFGGLVGLPLAGRAKVAADVEGTPRANRYNLALDGAIDRLATGQPQLEGLFGGRLGLTGTARLLPTGGYDFDDLTLTGAGATARLNGPVTPERADLAAAVTVPDLRRIDRRVSGRAEATGRVTGTLARPDATVRVAVTDATALGRPVPRLALDVAAQDLLGALDARLTLDGIVDGRPARGRLHVARPAGGGTVLDGLDLTIGSATAKGEVTLDAQSIARGRLVVNAPNLDDLSPLLLTKATGSVELDVALDEAGGGQNARLKADIDRIAFYGLSLTKADADLTATDIYRRPAVSGTASIDGASYGEESVSRIRLNAEPGPGGASQVTLTATARGFDLDARARVVPGERTRIEVSQLGATRGSQRFALTGPATLTLVDGGVDLRGVSLALGAGRLTIDGLAGRRLDLRAEARAVPLSVADLVSPGLGLSGVLEGSARIAGSTSAPTGEYRARIENLAAPGTRDLRLPRIDVTASGRFEGRRATLDAMVAAGRAGTLRIAGSVPVGDGALDLGVRGSIDAGIATNGLLPAAGTQLTGRVEVDARIGGTLASPEASGAATLSGGTFIDAEIGLRLTNIRARAVARGSEIAVESASATARNGGTVTASGRVRIDQEGFPGEIKVVGRNAEVVRNGLVTAVANLDLALSGPLASDLRVAGRVDVIGADIAVPEQLPGTLRPLPGTRHLNPTRTARARLALEARKRGRDGRAAPPFNARLDIALNAPGRIFVRGRGLNAELGGSLRLTGTALAPIPVGAFTLRSGTFQALTSRLNFTRGRLTFAGDLTPQLDFEAATNAGGAAIRVAVTGPANAPSFSFTSSPDLPQDEVLSRLLFNSPSGQLSAFQALALAQAAAQFSAGEGSDSFEAIRRSLGLTGFDINLGSSGGVGANAQRALGDRVSVGARAGASAGSTGVGADIRVTDQIRLQGQVGVTGGASIGVGAQWEW